MPEELLASLEAQSRARLGRTVAEFRIRRGQMMTQEKLADEVGITRTAIAHLEEGREIPKPELIAAICEKLGIHEQLWRAYTHEFFEKGFVFHELACELVGRRISMSDHSATDQLVALDRTQRLFQTKLTDVQAHAEVNSLLVFYGERPITRAFFERYLRGDAFASNEGFLRRLRQFQAEALRLYGNFRRAFTRMSRVEDLEVELSPLQPKNLDPYRGRSPFTSIKEIPPARLADLGYIAVQRINQQNKERSDLSHGLIRLADEIEVRGPAALSDLPEHRLRKLRTLLRKFESPVQLEHGLFNEIDPILLRSESARVAPEQADLVRIEQSQQTGLHNLGVYLSEPYMDVYVATSMREDADFYSVNSFVTGLFKEQPLTQLNLRYFNPTQSWIEDRVAKGLVEALMLRRAAVTVYMAQKGDTFGKDSEASVALGQGKAVVVYVPRLHDEEAAINSERVFGLSLPKLNDMMSQLSIKGEDDLDARERARLILRSQLLNLTIDQFKAIVFKHWADFDLLGEAATIESKNLRAAAISFVKKLSASSDVESLEPAELEDSLRKELIDRLVLVADRFESRAKTFRDIHPLSLQVIVRSGILNGILVTRSMQECARLLAQVVENTIQTDVLVDDSNYRLVERATRSTLRVVSRHRLLTFAFWSQYFEESSAAPTTDLPAVPL